LGTFTGFGVCSRFRWVSVVGRAFSRAMPCSGGRVAVSTPSRMATYSEKVGIDISVSTATEFKYKKKQVVTISTCERLESWCIFCTPNGRTPFHR